MSPKLNDDGTTPRLLVWHCGGFRSVPCIFKVMPLMGSVPWTVWTNGGIDAAVRWVRPWSSFEPSQVILPGKVTTLEFKHGKVMYIIYDAIETSD